MKDFKGLNKRLQNIYTHVHTVVGIVISFALFIIFFAGGFALFMDEAYRWENHTARYDTPPSVEIERAIDAAREAAPDFIMYNNLTFRLPTKHNPEIYFYGNVYEPDSTLRQTGVVVNSQNYTATRIEEKKSHMIETLYHLHFFDQIPQIGLYLSGLVGLFFLLATITGLIIHWKDLISKFYMLRTKSGWKNFWKDAHTTLSLIGLPFQLVYGVTGALLGLSILLLAPSVLLLFDGNQDHVRGMLDPFFQIEIEPDARPSEHLMSIDDAYAMVHETYPGHESSFIRIRNYGTQKAAISIHLDDRATLFGDGAAVVDLNKREIVNAVVPNDKGIISTYGLMIRLHYATFGGFWVKIIYFLLSLLTCFILISGILLWHAARDNKKYTDAQRRFHYRTTKVFLAICLGLVPAVGILFLANTFVDFDMARRIYLVDQIFFSSWLALAVSFLFIPKSFQAIGKTAFALTGVLGILIPISNGIVTGDWLWKTIPNSEWHVAGVDIAWILIGAGALALSVYIHRKPTMTATC